MNITEMDYEEGAVGARAPIFLQSLFFCDHFEQLQTVVIEVKLIINNAPLTYIHPNSIKEYLIPKSFVVWQKAIMLF